MGDKCGLNGLSRVANLNYREITVKGLIPVTPRLFRFVSLRGLSNDNNNVGNFNGAQAKALSWRLSTRTGYNLSSLSGLESRF